MLEPTLATYAVAVGGSVENRHGIVLAKNYKAKACGVTTGEPIWQAKQKCPSLVVIPPHYEEYLKYSNLARKIYNDYTDCVEPYGMDECWLDVSGSTGLLGSGEKIANELRERMKSELGLTISCGVSFNKIFAKLGSDMKKPDAVTVITRDNFKEKVWRLPASDLLGVGRSTARVLERYGIHTIGQLAQTPPQMLSYRLGKNGQVIIRYARGEDRSPVTSSEYQPDMKSVGHGITTREDLENSAEVWNVILALTQEIGHKLRSYGKDARGVSVDVRCKDLRHKQWQTKLSVPTHSSAVIARTAYTLFSQYYVWTQPVRAVTVRAIELCPQGMPRQITFFDDEAENERLERLESAVEEIRTRYGKGAIMPATLCRDIKTPVNIDNLVTMPTGLLTEEL